MRASLLAVLTIAACGSPPQQPTTPPPAQPDCAAAVATAELIASPDSRVAVKQVTALRCVEDHWSADATTCIGAAKTAEAAHACVETKLTHAQGEALFAAIDAATHDRHDRPDGDRDGLDPDGIAFKSIEPDRGDMDGGTYVRLTGMNFTKHTGYKIYFGDRQGEIVRIASDGELIVQAPGGKDGEVVKVKLVFDGSDLARTAGTFTFVDKFEKPPSVDDLTTTPPSGTQAAIAMKLDEEGQAAMKKKQYGQASSKFREAVSRVPEAKYFYNLCLSLHAEGKKTEALTACDAARNNNPTAALAAKVEAEIKLLR